MAPAVNGVNGVNSTKATHGGPSAWQAKQEVASHFIGGNHLKKATPSKVKDFVQTSDGHSVITNVSSSRFRMPSHF